MVNWCIIDLYFLGFLAIKYQYLLNAFLNCIDLEISVLELDFCPKLSRSKN